MKVAATPTLAENLLPRATALFQQTRPQIQITILTMDNLAAVTHVEEKRVDFGVVLSPVVHVEAQVIDLCTSELICVVHPEHALATRARVFDEPLTAIRLSITVMPSADAATRLSTTAANGFQGFRTPIPSQSPGVPPVGCARSSRSR